MLTRRNLLLLSGAAALVIGGVVLLAPSDTHNGDGGGGPAGAGDLVFPNLASRLGDARRIEVTKPDAMLVVERRGEAWVLPDKGGYPVRPARVRELLVNLTELRLMEPRTADPAQLDRLGLDDPKKPGSTALLVRVLDGSGAPIAEIVVGRRRTRTQGASTPESAYVRRPAETQSWLAEGRIAADTDPQLWIDRDVTNLSSDRVQRVEVHRPDVPVLVLTRSEGAEAGAGPRLAIQQPEGAPPADEVAMDEIARAFEFLTFLDVKPAAEIPGTAIGEGRFGLTEGLTVVVRPHRDGDALWILLGAEGTGTEAPQLAARWSPWAYQVGTWKEKVFLPKIEDLRRREASAPGAAAPAADAAAPATEDAPPADAPAPAATTPR
jgi:hypothetical protein